MLSLMGLGRTRGFILLVTRDSPQIVWISRFDNNFKLIRRKGTIVSVGNASGPVEPFAPIRLIEKNLKLLRPT